jgi:hypothetical protein
MEPIFSSQICFLGVGLAPSIAAAAAAAHPARSLSFLLEFVDFENMIASGRQFNQSTFIFN